MSTQKKPLPAAETGNGSERIIDRDDNTTLAVSGQGFRVWPLLPQGAANAIPSGELAALVGCDPRRLRFLVADERDTGAVILSDGRGYYRPSDGQAGREEMEAFVCCLINRGVNTIRATASARKALGVCLNQVDLNELLKELAQEAQQDG